MFPMEEKITESNSFSKCSVVCFVKISMLYQRASGIFHEENFLSSF